ncbi:unnamed protein product [Trifolium pratense]|uniref:Uncharacterized protein n=1 Tax=Trifolium pratense TaxID=57577 RepID=A0ACB0IRI1_TRIPR|nr:unnamed protein product [Trifolium pratense]
MNSSAMKFYTIFMFFSLVIILLIFTCESMGIFQRRCRATSHAWEGKRCHFDISSNSKCNSICVNLEHALSGACEYNPRSYSVTTTCYCNYNCSKYRTW